jgi:hypothetical protein
MQFPFFGISIVSHVFIIIIHKVFSNFFDFVEHDHHQQKNIAPRALVYLNSLIMLFVFIFVSFGAATMVYVSLQNKYSTLNIYNSFILDNNIKPTNDNAVMPISSSYKDEDCAQNYTASSSQSHISIVDFLRSNNKETSFEARESLANLYGQLNYQGTVEENLWLLNLLKDKEELENEYTERCQSE